MNRLSLMVALSLLTAVLIAPSGCGRADSSKDVIIYCGVDEPYASEVFKDFEKQTGLHVVPQYDIESSKSVGLAGKLEAEKDHPQADVWWSSEAFLSGRLAAANVLEPYRPTTAGDIPDQYKDHDGYWTGSALRARVLAVAVPPPSFPITSVMDLADPRLKGKVAISLPTAGATVAHVCALYATWGPDKARNFMQKLRDNQVSLLGGNAEVAVQVGNGNFLVGLTDTDDITDAQANGGKLTMVVPDQQGEGTLAMPTTVGLVKGARHIENAKTLIEYLVSRQAEQRLIDLHYAKWSVRGDGPDQIKAMKVDYRRAVELQPQAQREAMEILQGRK
jgi:iron(III) transport system substrate-binding protein